MENINNSFLEKPNNMDKRKEMRKSLKLRLNKGKEI